MATSDPVSLNTLRGLLHRTAAVLDEETKLLSNNPSADVSELAVRKNRCLFELSMAMKDVVPGQHRVVQADLELLKQATIRNERALSVHMSAAKDVISILGRHANSGTPDGTYRAIRG